MKTRAKTGELKMRWNETGNDFEFMWGEGASKEDCQLLHAYLCVPPSAPVSLLDVLAIRGYDLSTLRVSVVKKAETPPRRVAAPRPGRRRGKPGAAG